VVWMWIGIDIYCGKVPGLGGWGNWGLRELGGWGGGGMGGGKWEGRWESRLGPWGWGLGNGERRVRSEKVGSGERAARSKESHGEWKVVKCDVR